MGGSILDLQFGCSGFVMQFTNIGSEFGIRSRRPRLIRLGLLGLFPLSRDFAQSPSSQSVTFCVSKYAGMDPFCSIYIIPCDSHYITHFPAPFTKHGGLLSACVAEEP